MSEIVNFRIDGARKVFGDKTVDAAVKNLTFWLPSRELIGPEVGINSCIEPWKDLVLTLK